MRSHPVELSNNGDNDQYQQILENAHSLKGISGNLSGMTLHRITSKLEQAAKDHNIIEVNKCYEELNDNYQKFIDQLAHFLANI